MQARCLHHKGKQLVVQASSLQYSRERESRLDSARASLGRNDDRVNTRFI